MHYFIQNFPVIYGTFDWLLRLLGLIIVPRRRKPTSGTAWLLAIFLVPILGWIAFLLLGNFKLPKIRRDIQDRINKTIAERLHGFDYVENRNGLIVNPVIPSKYLSVSDLSLEYGRLPRLGANSLQALPDYDKSISSILQDINTAQKFVYIEYYALTLDDATTAFFESLERAKQRGVDVKVLYDSFGSRRFPGRRAMKRLLTAAKIPFRPMLPLHLPGKNYVRPDLRNHRKIVVIDNEIGYVGSQNLVDRSYHRRDDIVYDEFVVRINGPAVVELCALFLTDWISEGGEAFILPQSVTQHSYANGAVMQVLPSGPGFSDENNLRVFTHLLHQADREITIVNPYFVPPEPLLEAIISAATRGVRVRMVNSAVIDQWMVGNAQRSFYDQLLTAGVELYLYRKPRLLHAKFMVIDSEVCIIGSSNLDTRSFELDSELSLICYDRPVSKQLEKQADHYVEHSDRLSIRKWRKRPKYRQVLENVARLTSALQ